jgi:regulator of replication initiation timing
LGIQDPKNQASLLDFLIQGVKVTHFTNADEREIFDAILLLKDDEREWSSELEAIRRNLARLMERIMQVEWHYLEPEIGDLALNLIRETERGNDARGLETNTIQATMQSKDSLGIIGQQGSSNSGQCCGK